MYKIFFYSIFVDQTNDLPAWQIESGKALRPGSLCAVDIEIEILPVDPCIGPVCQDG